MSVYNGFTTEVYDFLCGHGGSLWGLSLRLCLYVCMNDPSNLAVSSLDL